MVALITGGQQASVNPLRRYIEDWPGWGGQSPPQSRFHQSQSRKRLLLAGNQMGKTRAGAAEAWWHATGRHPYRPPLDVPNEGWILASDLKNGWPKISQKLREIEPPGVLAEGCTYDEARGFYYRGIRAVGLANGSLMIGKGSDQSVTALSSGTIAWQWFDEPPKRSHWGEFIKRGGVKSAPIWGTLTPIGRPCTWLRNTVEGDPVTGKGPESPGWTIFKAILSHENAPHLSEARVEEMIADTPSWERGQRILAEWEGYTIGRRVPGFTDSNIVDDEFLNDVQFSELGLGADWGEVVGNTVWYLVGWDDVAVYYLAEWSPSERMTEAEEVKALRNEVLKPWGVDFDQILVGRGDSNSAGRRGIAATVNQLINRAIAREIGRPRPPFEMKPPYKGPGSVKARARIISSACVEKRLYVHQDCTRLIHSYRHWMGANDSLKHPFDAAGYIGEHWLSPVVRSGASMTLVR